MKHIALAFKQPRRFNYVQTDYYFDNDQERKFYYPSPYGKTRERKDSNLYAWEDTDNKFHQIFAFLVVSVNKI